jgi:hypothetical protein
MQLPKFVLYRMLELWSMGVYLWVGKRSFLIYFLKYYDILILFIYHTLYHQFVGFGGREGCLRGWR